MTQIFLGYPPEHIKNWIIKHYKPTKTKITFTDGSVEEYDWSGMIVRQTMIDAGLWDNDSYAWIREPKIVEIGLAVTNINMHAFANCYRLTSVTIPDSVTSIGYCSFQDSTNLTNMTIPSSVTSIGPMAFANCNSLKNVTFSGKDMATVLGMDQYPWELNSGCVLHCTDGDITI